MHSNAALTASLRPACRMGLPGVACRHGNTARQVRLGEGHTLVSRGPPHRCKSKRLMLDSILKFFCCMKLQKTYSAWPLLCARCDNEHLIQTAHSEPAKLLLYARKAALARAAQARRKVSRPATRCAASMAAVAPEWRLEWQTVQAPRSEVNLHFTLPTGQTFRWKRTAEEEYTGLLGERAVRCPAGCGTAACGMPVSCRLSVWCCCA